MKKEEIKARLETAVASTCLSHYHVTIAILYTVYNDTVAHRITQSVNKIEPDEWPWLRKVHDGIVWREVEDWIPNWYYIGKRIFFLTTPTVIGDSADQLALDGRYLRLLFYLTNFTNYTHNSHNNIWEIFLRWICCTYHFSLYFYFVKI